MKIYSVSIFLFLFPFTASATPKPLSLPGAVRIALESSPVFDSAKKTKAIRELEYQSASAKLLPSADFTTTNGWQNNIPLKGSAAAGSTPAVNSTAPWASSLKLGLTENLYDNGLSITNRNIAKLNSDLASINFLKARDSLILDIAAEFYRFSLASALMEVRDQQLAILQKQFKTLSNQYRQGLKTKNDFLRLKSQVQRAEIDRISAENNITLSAAELRKLMGVSFNNSEPPSFEPLPVKADQHLDAAFPHAAPAMENIYEYQLKKIQEEVDEKNITLAERKYWPQVSLASGITYTNQNYLYSSKNFAAEQQPSWAAGQQLTWNALVTLQYNIWDWGTQRRDVEIARYNRDIQRNTLDQGLLEINAKIAGIMADISRIGKSYKLSRELLALEEESNRNLETQFREGKVTYLDLITGLNNFLDAKVQFYTTYFDTLQISAKYKFYEGKLYEVVVGK